MFGWTIDTPVEKYIFILLVVIVFESVLTSLRSYVFSHTTNRIDVNYDDFSIKGLAKP